MLSRPELKGKLVHAKAGPAAATVPEGAIVIIAADVPNNQARTVFGPFLTPPKPSDHDWLETGVARAGL